MVRLATPCEVTPIVPPLTKGERMHPEIQRCDGCDKAPVWPLFLVRSWDRERALIMGDHCYPQEAGRAQAAAAVRTT